MNIFVLDTSPIEAAKMHCDQHLNKMILESAQMLSTALHTITEKSMAPSDLAQWKASYFHLIYKPAYTGHPCTKWVGESYANFMWVADLVYCLQAQLPRLHSSYNVVRCCEALARDLRTLFPEQYETPFVVAGPDDIKARKDLTVTEQYQEIYKRKALEWALEGRLMTYNQFGHRTRPEFMCEALAKAELNILRRQGRTNYKTNKDL